MVVKRAGNNPKRRIAPIKHLPKSAVNGIAQRVQYLGSPHHKTKPADYNFHPPSNPRPQKSVCDGVRVILKGEAMKLLLSGLQKSMFSTYFVGDLPKFVWSVDESGEVYEAKTDSNTPNQYHGYRLEEEDMMRAAVLKEWRVR